MANAPDGIQDYDASITWEHDWATHLATVGRTINTATVSCATAGITITGTTNTTTMVTFRLAATGFSTPTIVNVTTEVTLDNGDVDQRDMRILLTNT